MAKNILIINSLLEKSQPLINLFNELKQKGYSFYLLSSSVNLLNQFQKNNWPNKKIYLGPNLSNPFNLLIFIFLLPAAYLICLMCLAYYKFYKKITTVICLNWNEKIISAPVAKILKLQIVWIEYPDADYNVLIKPLRWLYGLNSCLVNIITFTSFTKTQLKKLGFDKDNINIIPLGIKSSQLEYQDTIFNKLAQTNKDSFHRKYFTVGTVVDLSHRKRIEALLKAIKICLTVIPDLQLIIVGGGKGEKNLTWLVKKMEIDNLVWFVGEPDLARCSGEQTYLRKWLDGFDVFAVVSETPSVIDLDICLHAMLIGLPIIGPQDAGLEDIITSKDNKGGILIETNNSEILARQIIKLQQNKRLRVELGKNARERVGKYFLIDKTAEQFKKYLEHLNNNSL